MKLKNTNRPGTWQEQCSKALIECVEPPDSEAWQLRRNRLARQQRVIIADVNFSELDLSNFDFVRCFIIRCDFVAANLSNTNFRQAILRECDFSRANFIGADLTSTDLGESIFAGVMFDPKSTRGNIASELTSKTRAAKDLKDFINEQKIIARRQKKAGYVLRAWDWLTDYGKNIYRILAIMGIINLLFAFLYFLLAESKLLSWSAPIVSQDNNFNLLEMATLSIQRFLNSPANIDSPFVGVRLLFICETTIGLASFSILLILLAKKLILDSR